MLKKLKIIYLKINNGRFKFKNLNKVQIKINRDQDQEIEIIAEIKSEKKKESGIEIQETEKKRGKGIGIEKEVEQEARTDKRGEDQLHHLKEDIKRRHLTLLMIKGSILEKEIFTNHIHTLKVNKDIIKSLRLIIKIMPMKRILKIKTITLWL